MAHQASLPTLNDRSYEGLHEFMNKYLYAKTVQRPCLEHLQTLFQDKEREDHGRELDPDV